LASLLAWMRRQLARRLLHTLLEQQQPTITTMIVRGAAPARPPASGFMLLPSRHCRPLSSSSSSARAAAADANSNAAANDADDEDALDLRRLLTIQDALSECRVSASSSSSSAARHHLPPLVVRFTPGDPHAAALLAVEEEEDDGAAATALLPPRGRAGAAAFCTNCLAPRPPLSEDDEHDQPCPSCGHRPSQDAELLGRGRQHRRAEAAATAGRAPPLPILLAWDEDDDEEEEDEEEEARRQRDQPLPSLARALAAPMARHRLALPPHPDRPERVAAAAARLKQSGLASRCTRVPTRPATDEELLRVHSARHVAAVDGLGGFSSSLAAASAPSSSSSSSLPLSPRASLLRAALTSGSIPPEMMGAGPATAAAARYAAGTAAELALRLVETLPASEGREEQHSPSPSSSSPTAPLCALALVRPAGAAASRSRAASGCYLNNAAVAARAAQAAHPGLRVMVVSLGAAAPVGVTEVFAGDSSVLVVSLHGAPPPPKLRRVRKVVRRRRSERRQEGASLSGGGGGFLPRAEDDYERGAMDDGESEEESDEDDDGWEEEERDEDEEDDDDDQANAAPYYPPGTHHLARPEFVGVGAGVGYTANVAWEAPGSLAEQRARRQQRRRRQRQQQRRQQLDRRPVSPPELTTPSPWPPAPEDDDEDEEGIRGALRPPGDADHGQAMAALVRPLAAEFRPGLVIVCASPDALAAGGDADSAVSRACTSPRPAPALSPEGFGAFVAAACACAPRALVLLEDGGGRGGGDLRRSARAVESALERWAAAAAGGGEEASQAAAALPSWPDARSSFAAPTTTGQGSAIGWGSVLRTLRALEGRWACSAALPSWLLAGGGGAGEDDESEEEEEVWASEDEEEEEYDDEYEEDEYEEEEQEDEEEQEGVEGDAYFSDEEDEEGEEDDGGSGRAPPRLRVAATET